jgi:hypothetical protein
MTELTPRKRVELALAKKEVDKVPFTVYENKIPQCDTERKLRNQGLCIVQRRYKYFKQVSPNVKVKEYKYREGGKTLVRTDFETPVGTVHTIGEPAGFTTWNHKRMFESKEDYKTLLFMIKDEEYLPDYENVLRMDKYLGEDFILRGSLGSEPLQSFISGYMGTEAFCFEWMDNRDEIIKLMDRIIENKRKLYKLAEESPMKIFNYGGNVTPAIIGLENFEKYYLPHYQEAAAGLHKKGKLIGVHFDADCKLLKSAIAKSGLDYIEAFTPAPDTDMSMKEAKETWPDKVLWINYPSSVHLQSIKAIKETTHQLIEDAGTEGLIIGITEDVPMERWQENFLAIMAAIEENAAY